MPCSLDRSIGPRSSGADSFGELTGASAQRKSPETGIALTAGLSYGDFPRFKRGIAKREGRFLRPTHVR